MQKGERFRGVALRASPEQLKDLTPAPVITAENDLLRDEGAHTPESKQRLMPDHAGTSDVPPVHGQEQVKLRETCVEDDGAVHEGRPCGARV